jgi:hypothetical protein
LIAQVLGGIRPVDEERDLVVVPLGPAKGADLVAAVESQLREPVVGADPQGR